MDKQQALVTSIAAGVRQELAPEFRQLAELLAKLTVTANATLVRLETLEAASGTGVPPAKRAVRAAAAPAPKGAAAKKTPVKKAAGEAAPKITNALLYFRHMGATDQDGFRETYGTETNFAEAEADATVQKRDKTKDAAGYWSAFAAWLWKNVLSDEDKDEVRAQFTAWKETTARDDAPEQLNEDDA